MDIQILIVEDDQAIADLIKMYLKLESYQVVHADDGKKAVQAIKQQHFHLALLDIMLPYLSGFELLELLKEKNTPVIFVTAKTNLEDKVKGLRLGADDYIVKPFEPLELLARVDVALRKTTARNNILSVGGITLDLDKHVVAKDGNEVSLTPIEYDILELFMRNRNLLFSREQLLDQIWGYDYYGSSRTVDMHIKNLRAKLDLGDAIQTVYKIGYRMVSDD